MVQNPYTREIYRGTPRSIVLQGLNLRVQLQDTERGEGFPPLAHRWVQESKSKRESYVRTLPNLAAALQPDARAGDSVIVRVPELHESMVFSQRNGDLAKLPLAS